jgi:glyoxylate/hydroxypyruvate reductase
LGSAHSHLPNILVYHASAAAKYKTRLEQSGYSQVFAASTAEEAAQVIGDIEVVLAWGIPTSVLRGQDSVRWIQTMSAGVDVYMRNREDLPSNVTLTRIVDQFNVPMTEYVFTYLLYLAKGVHRLRDAQQNELWKPFVPQSLKGKTMGVAGIGAIGGEVIRKARAFDMKVHGLSFTGAKAESVDKHFRHDEWLEFVRDLDVLVVILPLTDQTHHVVNREVLLAMKSDAILVNVGRGQLIDESALVEVMQSGHLQAAVLDVFEKEPLPAGHALWSLPNVYVTPHVSGLNSFDATSDYFLENLRRYQSGETLIGVVNIDRQY